MNECKINKYTIDFTEDDRITLYKKQIIDWWVEEAHPEISIRAEKIAKSLIESTDTEKEVEQSVG